MSQYSFLRAAALCWERAGCFDRAAERYARADAWADAGRCWAEARRFVEAANAYARAGEPINEARQWLASPWPERARRPYWQALETGLSTAAEVEALLGLGEIELASERAFSMVSENGRSVEALRSLARIAASRGRPDLAAHAWDRAIAGSPAAGCEVFKDWERALSWNRSLGWGRPLTGASGWPSRAFRDIRLELVWKERVGHLMYGNRALAWSADGRRFAAAREPGDLILGDLMGREVRYRSIEVKANAVVFLPESDSVLVGCDGGQVVRVDASGAIEELEALRMLNEVWGAAVSPQGDRLAISGWTSPGALLRIFSWEPQNPRSLVLVREERAQHDRSNSSLTWSPDGRALAWCPGPWSQGAVSNDLYLFSDAGVRCVTAAHENSVNGIAFSPDGRYLFTASKDQTLAVRDAHTGETITPPWICALDLRTVVPHPLAALVAAGGTQADHWDDSSRLYLFRFSQENSPHLEIIQENPSETSVLSLAFSSGGDYLLMSTVEHLTLFRVHLI